MRIKLIKFRFYLISKLVPILTVLLSIFISNKICGNGMITFNANSWSNYRFPKPFGGPGSLSSLDVVAPFWSFVSEQQPANAGTFYESIQNDLLKVYSNNVRTALKIKSFTATWGIQVTWNKLIANASSPTSPVSMVPLFVNN